MESKLKAKCFDITQPMVVMYNEIQDLQDLAIARDSPYSDTQLVEIGILLIKNMNETMQMMSQVTERRQEMRFL